MADSEVTLNGQRFLLAADTQLPSGKRAWVRTRRPSVPVDPGVQRVAQWQLGGYPMGNSREDTSQGAGLLSTDWTEGIDILYDQLALPGPKVFPTDLVSISQAEYVETADLMSTSSDGSTATSDPAVGTLAWADPEHVLTDDADAATASGAGVTEYLKVLLGAAPRIPASATLAGFRLRFRRRASATPAWTVIDSTTLAMAASSVSFTSIPSIYRLFRVTAYVVKDGTGGAILLRFNNDSGTNYDSQRLTGDSTSVAGARTTGGTSIDVIPNVPANGSASVVATVGKQVAAGYGMVVAQDTEGGTVVARRVSGRWNNSTDLIDRIDLISSAGNFAAGTVVVLEGVAS